ncbi:MAG: hypothetical protein ABR572_08720 [Cryomorphaceae bacterium]|nr:hypothetical protein [Flavobacteriales bacterium]
MSKLNDEMLKLKLRKEIIRREFSDSVDGVRRSIFRGGNLITLVTDLFRSGFGKDEEADKFDKAVQYTDITARLLNIINAMRK